MIMAGLRRTVNITNMGAKRARASYSPAGGRPRVPEGKVRGALCLANCLPFLAMVVTVTVAGCAASRDMAAPPADVETGTVRLERIKRPEQAGQWESGEGRVGWETEAYRLQPGDEIEIRVLYNDDLSTTTRVLPDGSVAVPIVGQTKGAGKTLAEFQGEVARGLAELIVDPKVTVIPKKLAGNYVFVLGEVRNPGAYEITGTMTVTQAIARAGGALDFGKLNSVLVVRRTAPDALTGIRVNVSTVLANQARAKDRVIRAYDIVYVPRTLIGRIDTFLEQFFTRTSSPWLWYIWMRTAADWDKSNVTTAVPIEAK